MVGCCNLLVGFTWLKIWGGESWNFFLANYKIILTSSSICVCVCVCFMESFSLEIWKKSLQASSYHWWSWWSLHVHRNPQTLSAYLYTLCEFYSKDDDDHDDHVFNRTYPQNFVAFLFAVMGLLCQIPLNYKMGNNNNTTNSCCCCSTPAFLPSSLDPPHTHLPPEDLLVGRGDR
jgi:hypothetical protein